MSGAERQELLAAFPRQRTWLLPALQAVQHRDGWLSTEALGAVAAHLRVAQSEVWGVATHYPEFRLSRPGRRIVRVCVGVSCRARGSAALLGALEGRLGISAGAATPDGGVTLEPLDCAFNCSMAPVVEVDGRHLGRVAADDLDRVLTEPAPGAEDLRVEARAGQAAPLRLAVAIGSCSLSVGAGATLAALRGEASRPGPSVGVGITGCPGLCWAAPAVTVLAPDRPPIVVPHVGAERARALLEAALAGEIREAPAVTAFLAGQRRELTARCGVLDPEDIDDAIHAGSYTALAAALTEGSPERLIETVKASGLQGRGGAYFQAAIKWDGARRAPGTPKYLIVNGEEGEPGIFKDRHLMEGDPHRLLEGALLAARAAGASVVYLYVHGEAHLSARRLERAVADARRRGFIGPRVLGSDFSVEVEIRRGAGGFVLGEETALMESIEGKRALPRARPPFPVEAGLWGRPTVINNVETLFAVPLIAARGAGWWTGLGGGRGTKLFGLSGHVARPGVVEVEMGGTLRDLIEGIGGGVPGGRALKAVAVGGPSGALVPARQLDEPMLPAGAVSPGTGGIAVLDSSVSAREVVRLLLDFNTRESCGKCTPCREGTARMRDMLDAGTPLDRAALAELSDVVRLSSLCGLGQAAPLSILSGLREFPEDLPGRAGT